MIITIDGTSASGKSSVARAIAKKCSLYYINSGFFFRALTYLLLKYGGYTPDTLASVTHDDAMKYLSDCIYIYDKFLGEHILYQGVDITPYLKEADIDRYTPLISDKAPVRELIKDKQRKLADEHDVIIDGRDTGTNIFPEADYKFFITASLAVRAGRWQRDQEKRGNKLTLDEAIRRVHDRDMKDMSRAVAPLQKAPGSIEIDTSNYTAEQTTQALFEYVGTLCSG